MLRFVLEEMGRLIVSGDPDRGMTSEVRIALNNHRLSAGFFHTFEKRFLQFGCVQGSFQCWDSTYLFRLHSSLVFIKSNAQREMIEPHWCRMLCRRRVAEYSKFS